MALIDSLKFNLGILGADPDTDAALNDIIARGKAHLEGLAGVTPLDFETEGLAKSLLLDYCRYDYNNAPEYFEENFAKEILRLQLQVAADALATETAEAGV